MNRSVKCCELLKGTGCWVPLLSYPYIVCEYDEDFFVCKGLFKQILELTIALRALWHQVYMAE